MNHNTIFKVDYMTNAYIYSGMVVGRNCMVYFWNDSGRIDGWEVSHHKKIMILFQHFLGGSEKTAKFINQESSYRQRIEIYINSLRKYR